MRTLLGTAGLLCVLAWLAVACTEAPKFDDQSTNERVTLFKECIFLVERSAESVKACQEWTDNVLAAKGTSKDVKN